MIFGKKQTMESAFFNFRGFDIWKILFYFVLHVSGVGAGGES